MIIAHNISAINTYNRLGATSKSINKTSEKLSSGYQINRAADNAAGLSISEKMRSQIRGLNQAADNVEQGISMIQTAEGALNESHAILQRMRELCVQSANDTNSHSDREALQSEINQLISEINRIGNTTEFNGMKILNGSKTRESIEYVKIPKGGDIYLEHSSQGSINTAKLELVRGNAIKLTQTADAELDLENLVWEEKTNYVEIGKKDGKLTCSINLVEADSTSTDVPNITPSGNAIHVENYELLRNTNGDYYYNDHGVSFTITKESAQKFIEGGEEGEIARVDIITALNVFQLGSINPTEIEYTLTNDYLPDTNPKGEFYGLKLDPFDEAHDRPLYDEVEIEFTNNVRSDAGDPATADFTFYFEGNIVATEHLEFKGHGVCSVKNHKWFPETSVNGITFGIMTNKQFQTYDKIHCRINLLDKLGYEEVKKETLSDNSVYFHVGANMDQVINTEFGDMRARALGLTGEGDAFTEKFTVINDDPNKETEKGLNISNRKSANLSIGIIDNAISIVSEERSRYGAIQNRLEYTMNNITTTAENMQNAESTIRDTDMASEMMELTKSNILSQASQAMLAQAMQRPQQVLQLLQQ